MQNQAPNNRRPGHRPSPQQQFPSSHFWRAGCVCIALLCWSKSDVRGAVTFDGLLDEMINRDSLAQFPAYGLFASDSHDPLSDVGPSTADWAAWFANYDLSQFHGTYNGENILLSDTGAGALVRLWTADTFISNHTLKFYIDGSTTPISILTGNVTQVLGANASFGSPLSSTTGTPNPVGTPANLLYAPIPYQNKIVVTYIGTGTLNLWYNADYRKYAPGTAVTSFAATTPAQSAAKLASTNQWLANPASAPQNNANLRTVTKTATLTTGQYAQALFNGASGAVRKLQLTLNAADMPNALQNTVLEIRCDNQKTVEVPVGQFFGTGPAQLNPISDYYRTVEPATKTLTSYWTMPYQNAMDIRVVNKGTQQLTATLTANKGDYAWDANSMYFHANYRSEANITAGVSDQRRQDWNYLRVKGKGVFLGDTLAVTKAAGQATGWWGEGDEKIWVDSSPASSPQGLPRIFGTGAEDYYNYAAGNDAVLSHPFFGQPQGAANRGIGTTVNSRLNGLDAIPFNSSLQRDQEILSHVDCAQTWQAASFWYGMPGSAAWKTVANVRDGVDAAINSTTYNGNGQWKFVGSNQMLLNTASGQGTAWDDLAKMTVGNAGNTGLGVSGASGFNLPAIGKAAIFSDGVFVRNDEIALHPGGNMSGTLTKFTYATARWTADASSAGTININGSIRDLVPNGDSVDFHILVNGIEKYAVAASASSGILPESFFNFETTVQAGSTVDFVLGNHGGTLAADESVLRATISVPDGIGQAATLSAYQQWKTTHGLALGAADDGDPDGDGIPTLVEYALGLDPAVASTMPVAITTSRAQYLTLAATKNLAATGVSWDAEVSANLANWFPSTITANTASHFEATDTTPISGAAKRFIRLKITHS
jgi:hypothetical protein